MNTRELRRQCEGFTAHMKYADYWQPDKLKYLLYWYPHWGAEPLVKELNIPIRIIQHKAHSLTLKMLRPRETRLCYYCRVNCVGKHRKFGLRCTKCFKPYRADKRRATIHQNPLKGRLRELVYQLNSRNRRTRNNRRTGVKTKISVEMLLQLWNQQEGRCAYTGRKMLVSDGDGGKRSPDTLSVDRVNSRQRYFRNNMVLCTWWANVAKHEIDVSDFVERCREVVQKADSIKQQTKTQ